MKVSVIIPYNITRGYLEEAVDSVEKQTYKNVELIIEQSDAGVSTNLNNGIKKSTGDIIRYLSEDDILPLDSVEKTVEYFKNNNEDFIHSNAVNFWPTRTELWIPYKHKLYDDVEGKIPTLQDMVKKNRIHGGTVSYRTKCFEHRMFDESLWTAEEWDFNLWLLKNKYKLGYLDEFTYKWRRHDGQKSLGKKSNQLNRMKVFELIRGRYGAD